MDELDSEFMKKSVKKANLLTGNMSKTIDDFRNFFKPNKIEESFNINDSINKSVSLVESSFENNNIEMKINYSEKSLVVRGYPNEFSQALVNLLNNAKDAFLESTDEIKSKKLIINSYNNSKYAIVEIIDNAMGIDVEIIEKIFDPYFSTKEEGKGVGIGLYMTKMIIEKNMNGLISVSNLENGVIFTIKLPLEIIDGQEE